MIPCLNEEANIKNFLNSLLSQTENGFVISRIIIVSDGSTDNTVAEAKTILDNRISIVDNKERMGKSSRLNKFFHEGSENIIAFFDADIIFDSTDVLGNLLRPLIECQRVGLVGGNAQQLKGRTFVENAINVSCNAFDKFRVLLGNGNNPFGANGCAMALKRELAKQITVPENTIANDQFLYFSCLTKNYEFRHVRNAVVWYRSPNNLNDHIRQNTRFVSSHLVMERIFGELAVKEYTVPKFLFYKTFFSEFLKHPIHATFIFVVNRYCKYLSKKVAYKLDSKWFMAKSTKNKINK